MLSLSCVLKRALPAVVKKTQRYRMGGENAQVPLAAMTAHERLHAKSDASTGQPPSHRRRDNIAVAPKMLTHRHMRAITHFWQEMYQALSVTLCLEWYKSHISEITSNTVSDYHWGPPASVFLWVWQHGHRSVPVKILCNIFSLYFIVETTMTSQTGASSHLAGMYVHILPAPWLLLPLMGWRRCVYQPLVWSSVYISL